MSDVNANIGIHFDTNDALEQLRRLQAGLSRFNQSLTQGNVAAENAQKGLNAQLMQSINATGKFVASQKTVSTSTASFTEALEKNKLSMREYFRYTAAAATANTKVLKGAFSSEREIINRARKDRVKALQTQYIQLTDANGQLVKTLQIVPKHLKMVNGEYTDYATRVQMAAQRQQLMNQLLKQGSTQLLNFGKNTQWAGRQLMVGITVPLTMLGGVASKAFQEMEEAVIKFTRVYGDMTTSVEDTDKAVRSIQLLAKEFTKYGIAAADTVKMAADAAAMGLTGTDLTAQVTSATKLAVLGQVEQQQALETTISLQNAFGISADQLAQKINFLNAVENQTVLSIADLTEAIPKAGPVIKQLGGNVEDLAFFMTAMKEGGINASEGANALKSGLASMINPSKKASEMLAGFGISIKGIVDANAGNLKGTVLGIARALDTLDPLNRARAIETMFGKFQFARISTLFQNITKDGSQASRALGLASASVEELAILSERELGKVENAVGVKFKKQMENLKLQLVPIGKAFLEAITPVVKFAACILERFNNLSDGTKKFVVMMLGFLGGIAPIALMTFGVVANGVANLIKFFALLRGGMAKLNGQNNVLGGGFDYLTQQEIESLAQAKSLHNAHQDLIATFNIEKASVDALAAAYANAASQARALASGSPGLFNTVPGPSGAVSGLPKFADGKVPGNPSDGDSVLALVQPGETVVPTKLSEKYGPVLSAIMQDKLPGFSTGYSEFASQSDKTYAASAASGSSSSESYITSELGRIRKMGSAALLRYAEAVGMDVADASEASLEKIRDVIIGELKDIVQEAKDTFGSASEENIAKIGKRSDPQLKSWVKGELQPGSSRMGQWAPKFNQLNNQEFSHVGQTQKLESNKLSLTPEAQAQVEGIKEFFTLQGKKMPELRVADAHAMTIAGKFNNAMSSEGKARGYEKKNGAGSLGRDFEEEFVNRGVEKWQEMTVIMGKDFDQLKGQAKVYDDALAQRLKEWNAVQERRIADGLEPELMTDDVFAELEYEVRQGIKDQIPEWNAVIESAKQVITELRLSVGEETAQLNAFLESKGLGTVGKQKGNTKVLNAAVRGNVETGKREGEFLGTQPLHEGVKTDVEATENFLEMNSPSKRTKRIGIAIGDGLKIGLEESTAGVKAQSDKLAKASVPTVDTANKAKYDLLKNDPDQRQIQKSIDRHYRGITGKTKVPVPQNATETETSVSVAVNPKALAKDAIAVRDAVKNAKKSAKKASKAQEELADATQETASEQKKHTSEVKNTRKKSKKTADAAGDVLVAETDVARSTARTATASETQAQNVVSAADLTQATENALQESASNNNQILQAEEDRAKSAEEIAKLENAIEEQKRKEKEAGQAAIAARMAKPTIPAGSQTAQNVVNPMTAMGYEEAYDLAGEYTRDKKGQLLMDPETGEPTTLSKKQITKKKRGMRREKVGKFSGKASGALGTAAMVAGMAGAPPKVTAALGTAATVAQFAPMLAGMGPVGWAAAGIMAVGAGAYMLNKHFNKMAAEAAKFATSTSATRESMKKMGEITGKVGASEIMDRRRGTSRYNKYSDSIKMDKTFGQKFMKSDLGKDTKKTFQENVKKMGIEQATSDLSLKLAAQIADGVLDKDQAESIAQALALSMKDQKIEMQVTGKLRTLIGPDGEDLKNKPLKTRMLLVATARQRSEKQLKTIDEKKAKGESVREDIAMLAAYNTNNLELASMMADQVENEFDTQKRKLETEIASTTNLQKKIDLEKQLAGLTEKNNADQKRTSQEILMNIAQAEIDFQKVFSDTGIGGQAMREDAYFDASRSTVESAYKGTSEEAAAKKFLDKTKGLQDMAETGMVNDKGVLVKNGLGTERAAQTFQAKMEMMVGSKVISPTEANAWMNMFSGKLNELDLAINTSIKQNGVGKTKELFAMFSGFSKKKVATSMIQEILLTKKDPAEFDAVMEALANLQSLDGTAIDMEVLVSAIGLEGVEKLKKEFEAIEADKDKLKKEGKKFNLEEESKKGRTSDAAVAELNKDAKQREKFNKLNVDQQADYLQKLSAAYAYQTQVDEKTLALEAEQHAKTLLWQEGIKQEDAAYAGKLADYIKKYLSKSVGERAVDSLDYLLDPTVPSKSASGATPGSGNKERDTTYDDIMKRLRNVRLAALNAAGGFKELEKAIAKSGSKSIGDKFRGLEQQLITLGKTGQFTDYLAGLDQKELNKFGKAATKKGIDPNTGKKKKGVKVGDFILSDKGEKMEKGFNKAIIGDYNKAQLQSVTLSQQEIQARTKLLAMGFKEADIKTMLADENYRTLIATGKVTKKELETNAALTEQARLRDQINSLVTAGRDKKEVAENQKRIPEVVKMLQMANVDAEGIRSAISDPSTLKTLLDGMDNFATLGQDAQNEFREVIDQINDIPTQKIIELVFTQSEAEKQIAGSQAAAELFDAYKMIDENTIKNAEGNTYAGLQVKMEDLNNQSKVVQDQINLTQSKIDTMQQEVEADQRKIENDITRPIEKKQRAIEKLSRDAEMNFSRPISALQERSAVLAHDLEVMNHSAEEINKKYDKQQEALQQVANINQQIIQQQQQQLGLADALSKGDISAAAKAVQDMRATGASNYATNAQDALQKARENEIKGLKGGVSGLTQDQIQEQQYQIGLQVYDLEQKKAAVDKQILVIQDEIYALEQQRQTALDAIQVKTDAIAKIQFGELLDQQNKLKAITDQNLKYQLQSDLLFNQIATNDKNRIIQGATRSEWDAMLKAAEAQEKLAKGDLAKALGVVGDISGKAATAWKSIKDAYDGIVSKSVEITQYIKTVYGPAPENPATQQTPTTTKPTTTTTPTTPTVQTGNGPDAKKDQELAAKYAQIAKDTANDDRIAKAAAAAARAKADAAAQASAAAITKAKLSGNYAYQAMLGGMSSGGLVPKYFAAGGFARGTDIVPAMLTPGEFVMSKYAVNTHGLDTLKAMNAGAKTGDSVYNYSLTVNAGSNATPDDIARTVMNQIKQIDSQRIRGNRL